MVKQIWILMGSTPLPLDGEECRRWQLLFPSGQCVSATRCPQEQSTISQPVIALTPTWKHNKQLPNIAQLPSPLFASPVWLLKTAKLVFLVCVRNRMMPPAVTDIRIPNMIEPRSHVCWFYPHVNRIFHFFRRSIPRAHQEDTAACQPAWRRLTAGRASGSATV